MTLSVVAIKVPSENTSDLNALLLNAFVFLRTFGSTLGNEPRTSAREQKISICYRKNSTLVLYLHIAVIAYVPGIKTLEPSVKQYIFVFGPFIPHRLTYYG